MIGFISGLLFDLMVLTLVVVIYISIKRKNELGKKVVRLLEGAKKQVKDLWHRNDLYYDEGYQTPLPGIHRADRCKRLSRRYQIIDFSQKYREPYGICPHCEEFRRFTEITEHIPWADQHLDCPPIGVVDYIKLQLAVHQMGKMRKHDRDNEFFEEYNKRKPNADWMESYVKNRRDAK